MKKDVQVIDRNCEMFLMAQVVITLFYYPVEDQYAVVKTWDGDLLHQSIHSDLAAAKAVYNKELWRPVTASEVLD